MMPKSKISSALVISVAVFGALGVGPGAPVFAEGMRATAPQLSRDVGALVRAAQELMKATPPNYAEAIVKLREANGTAGKTPYDQYVINDFLGFDYIKTNNYADAAKAIEAEIGSGLVPQSDLAPKLKELANISYQIRNYDKAIEYGNRAIEGGFGDEQIRTIVGQSYYLKGDWNGTLKFEEGIADARIKAGGLPKEQTLRLIYSACQKLNDDACSNRAMEKLAALGVETDRFWRAHLIETTRPTRRDGPLREVNLSDEEVREIQAAAHGVVPEALVNISGVVSGCPCEDGAGCSDQVWIVAHRPGLMKGLQLSRMGGHWAVGPVQQWWLEFEDFESRFASAMAGRMERQKFQEERQRLSEERQKLYDKFPACASDSSSPGTVTGPLSGTAKH
jgi:tetratricopeptide (TPR) repeat protein